MDDGASRKIASAYITLLFSLKRGLKQLAMISYDTGAKQVCEHCQIAHSVEGQVWKRVNKKEGSRRTKDEEGTGIKGTADIFMSMVSDV